MSENRKISSVIDTPAVQAEIKNMTDELKNAAQLIKDFPKIASAYKDSSSASDMRKNTEAMADANNRTKKTITDLQLACQQYETVLKQTAVAQAKVSASQSDAGKALAATREEQRQVNIETKNTVIANTAAEGSLVKMRAQLTLLIRQYDLLGKAEREGTKGKELLEKTKAINIALVEAEAATGRFGRNVGNYKSAFDGLGMSFAQVSRELPSLTISAQQFFLAISNNLPMVADEIAKARKEVAALKAEGKDTPSLFQRITGAMFSWQTALSVGITLLTLYGKEAVTWVGHLFKGADALEQIRANQQAVNDIMHEANQSAAEEITNLKLLYAAATDVNKPMKERLENVQALQSTYPDTFANLNQEIILTGQAKDQYDALAASILTAARAEAGKKKLVDIENQKLDIENQKDKITNAGKHAKEAAKNETYQQTAPGYVAPISYSAAQQNQATDKRTADALAVEEEKLKKLNAQSDFIIRFVGKANLVEKTLTTEEAKAAKLTEGQLKGVINNLDNQMSGLKEGDAKLKTLQADRDVFQKRLDAMNNKPAPKGRKAAKPHDDTNEALAAQKRLIDAKAGLSRLDLEEDAKQQKAVFENEKESLHKRILALDHFTEDKRQLAMKDSQAETAEIDLKLNKIAEIEKKSVKARTQEEKNLVLYKDALLIEKQTAEKKCNIAIEDLARDHQKTMEGIYKQNADAVKKGLLDDVQTDKNDTVAKNYSEQGDALEALMQKYEQGKITLQEFEERKKKLSEGTDIANLDAEKEALEGMLDIYDLFGDSTVDIEKKLNEVKQKLRDKDFEHFKETEEKKAAIQKQAKEKWAENAHAAYDLGVELIDGGFERRAQSIDKEIAANTAWKDAELDRINTSTLSEQDKAAKIATINAAAQSKQDQMEAKKRDIQLKQAKFDRDAQVLKIAGDAISAHFKLVAQAGIPGIGLAIANDVAAAIQIGMLLGKPLPKFYGGKNVDAVPAPRPADNYEGPAWVDDGPDGRGNKPELIERKDGSIEVGGNQPRIVWLDREDKVWPDAAKAIERRKAVEHGPVKSIAAAGEVPRFFRGKNVSEAPALRIVVPSMNTSSPATQEQGQGPFADHLGQLDASPLEQPASFTRPIPPRFIHYDELNQMMLNMMLAKTANAIQPEKDFERLVQKQSELAMWSTGEITKALQKQKKTVTVNNHIDLGWTEYLKQNIYD